MNMLGASPQEKIVVVGFGWVGQANALALVRMGYTVSYYDIVVPPQHYASGYSSLYKELHQLEKLLATDSPNTWYIVCIGDRVSEEGDQDITFIERALQELKQARGKVILRSTVLPDTLARLPFHYYFPEFLHEQYAVEECLNPFYFALGERITGELPSFLIAWQDRAYKVFRGTPEQCSYIKYLSNIWNAIRIAFVNEFGDTITTPRDDKARQEIEQIIDFLLERKGYLRYGRAFGGHCLPKDMRAFMAFAEASSPVPLLRGAMAANMHHEKIEREFPTLPQWFSAWEYHLGKRRPYSLIGIFFQKINRMPGVTHVRRFVKPFVRRGEELLPHVTLEQIKKKWNELARENPFYYTHSDTIGGRAVDEFELRQTGEADYKKYIESDQLIRDTVVKEPCRRVLEIGCGVGRMTEFFARDFPCVIGIDTSSAMLAVAARRLGVHSAITLQENDGRTIPFPAAHFDIVFSYLVFKHLPTKELAVNYFSEVARVLKPTGLAKIQVRGGVTPHRWQWFYGVAFTEDEIRTVADHAGLTIVKTEKESNKSLWAWLRRKNQNNI